MSKKIVVSSAMILIIVVIGFVWWRSMPTPAPKYTGPVEKLRIATTREEISSPVFFASSNEYFKKVGLEVEIQEVASGKAALELVLKGEADVATVGDVPIEFIAFERQDFSILATFATNYNQHKLVIRKDSGITSVVDLKNKKIGTLLNSGAHFELYNLLIKAGLSIVDVKIVSAKPPELPALLAQKEVDAIVIWDPYAADAEKLLLGNSITLPSSGLYRFTYNLVSRNDFIKSHKEALVRLMNGIDLANDFIHHNNEEAKNLVGSWLEKPVQDIPLDIFDFQLTLDQTLLLTLEDEARWAIQNKLTDKTKIPNYLDYIYFDALEKVKPEAVTIVH